MAFPLAVSDDFPASSVFSFIRSVSFTFDELDFVALVPPEPTDFPAGGALPFDLGVRRLSCFELLEFLPTSSLDLPDALAESA